MVERSGGAAGFSGSPWKDSLRCFQSPSLFNLKAERGKPQMPSQIAQRQKRSRKGHISFFQNRPFGRFGRLRYARDARGLILDVACFAKNGVDFEVFMKGEGHERNWRQPKVGEVRPESDRDSLRISLDRSGSSDSPPEPIERDSQTDPTRTHTTPAETATSLTDPRPDLHDCASRDP